MNKYKKPSKLKELQLKFKRWQEMEEEKKKLKKQDINYSIKPKGYFARKFGVIFFWFLFGFMFLVVITTLFSKNSEANLGGNFEVKVNQATTPEAIQFAENFLKDYLTWTVSEEGRTDREQKMIKYVAEELRGHSALDIKGLEWDSQFKWAELKKITEKGENLAYITFLVGFDFTKIKDSDTEQDKETKQLQKYIEVPIAYDGYSYGVYELPKFTYIFEDETSIKKVQTTMKSEQVDVSILNRIKEFLPTFFKTYAEDEQEKLNYMIKGENVTNGLNGTMLFDSLVSVQAYNGEKENQFIVFTEVKFVEPETKTPFIVSHQLEITLEQDKLLVSGMNNQRDKGVISNIKEREEKETKETDLIVEESELDEEQEN